MISDYHWDLRINALMPEYPYEDHHEEILQDVAYHLPDSYQTMVTDGINKRHPPYKKSATLGQG